MPYARRLLPVAVSLAALLAVPAFADDWETCAKGRGDDAIAACTRAIKSGTYTGRVLALAYSNRGVELKAKGDLAKAIADYNDAIKADPQQSAAYNNRGIAYAAGGAYDKAIADYDEAIRLDLKYASALNRLYGIADQVEQARGEADLAKAEQQIDDILKEQLATYAPGEVDAGEAAALSLATHRLERQMERRRRALGTTGPSSS